MSFTSNFLKELEKKTGQQINAGGSTPPATNSVSNYTQNFLQALELKTRSANPDVNRARMRAQKLFGKTTSGGDPEKKREQIKILKNVNSFASKKTVSDAESAAKKAEKEYEDFLNSEEYAAMLDRKGMAQLPGNELFAMLTGYSRQEEDRLKLREQQLRQKAEQLRSVADQFKEQEIYVNAEALAEKAEAELERYLHSEEYAAWEIARDKQMQERAKTPDANWDLAIIPSVWDQNQREQELRATAEYYRQVATAKQEQAMMAADLQELAGWSRAEQDALKVYALGNYQNAMARPEQAAAFASMNSPEELFRKYGEQRVKEIAESYMRSQSQEARQMVTTAAQEGAGNGFWAGAGHSLASVGANLAGTLTGPLGYLAEATGRTGRYSTLDPNNPGQMLGTYAGAVRQEVAGNIQYAGFGKAGATVYQAGMSALDNLARMVAAGGTGSLALAATGSFGQAVSQYSAQGATPMEAVTMGIINGGLEVLTEKMSLDNILEEMATPKTGLQMLKAALRAGGIEVTEEERSFLGSALAEAAWLREKSGYQQQVAMLKAFGLSDAAAREQAARGVINEAWQTAIQSFLSGGMMSGATSLYGNAVNKAQEKELQKGVAQYEQELREVASQEGAAEDGQQAAKTGTNGLTVGEVMASEGAQVSPEIQAQAERIAAFTGRTIEFYTANDGKQGSFGSDGVLRINTNAKDPVGQIIAHELTHSIEQSGAYKQLSKLVLDRIGRTENLEQRRQEKRALYSGQGVQLEDNDAVDKEIVASYVADHLLSNEQEITSLTQENPGLGRRILNWLDGLLAKMGSSKAQEREFIRKARDIYARALKQTGATLSVSKGMSIRELNQSLKDAREARRNGEITDEEFDAFLDDYFNQAESLDIDTMSREDARFAKKEDGEQYAISQSYAQEIDEWNREGKPEGETFIMGSTGDVLQGLGAIESDIYIRGDKVNTILQEHPEMTVEEIKRIPEILDDPVLILKSRNYKKGRLNTRLVMYGSVKAQNGQPILCVLDLRPIENGLAVDDMQKVNSAYTKDGMVTQFIANSDVVHVDKKRTPPLLRTLGFYMPSELQRSGSIGSISYRGQNVNIEGVPFHEIIGEQDDVDNKNGAPQVLDDNAPGRDVQNELASAPSKRVADNGSDVKRQYSISEQEQQTSADDFMKMKEEMDDKLRTGEWTEEDYNSAIEELERKLSSSGNQKSMEESARSVESEQQEIEGEATEELVHPKAEAAPDAEPEAKPKGIRREELPAKARKYLESAERGLLNNISEALGVPYHAKRNMLKPMIEALSNEYLSTGTISQESMDRLFEEAYEAGVVIDREFYDQYKNVKEHLRITKEGGMPVDSYYRKLQEMAPELFPDHITHPADQLQRMLEVGQSIRISESSLDSYYGNYAQEYKAWQKNDFIAAINDDLAELRTVQRYAQEKNKAEQEDGEISLEEAAECWAQLKAARRNYEKVNAKNLLSLHDEMQVGRLLRGEVLLEHLEGEENFKGIKAIYEAKQEYEKIAKQIGRYKHQVRKKRLDRADELLKTANEWKDKKTGIQYSRETMRRNILDIVPDQKVAADVLKEYFKPVQHSEALSTKFKTEYRDRVRALNLNTKVAEGNEVSEAYAVQLLGEAMDNIRVMENARGRIRTRDGRTLTEWRALIQDMWEHSPNLDRAKIEGAVKEFRKIYDELFQKMNMARMENGYEPVNYRQGYFPHFQPSSDGDSIIAYFGKVLGIDTNVEALPTTINGLTHTFKPGIQWFGNAQERLGFKTAYDAVEGFDKYIEGVSSVIHHTENIQKLRALATQARYRTSDEGIRQQVDSVQMDTRLTDEERQMKIREIYEKGKFALSNFVLELDEYTNLLANKKSRFDRTMESFMGRRAYTIMKNVESRVAANMIAGNISSAVTNFIPLTQAMGRIGSTELLRGMKDARRAIIGGTSDFVGMSDFLTNRRGSDVLVKAWSDKLSSKLGMPMELIDNFTSEAIVRAAYYQNIKRGMSESEAIHDADIMAASIMADRSKGSMPTLFESTNPLFKALTQFQLEVNNQYSEIFKDMPREYAEQAKWVLALGFMKYFIAAFLFNELEEKLKGRRSALDPIGIAKEFIEDWRTNGFGEAGSNLTVNLLEGMPFSSALNLLGIDIDGGRVPVSSAIPDIPALWQAMTDKDMSGAERWDTAVDELQKPIIYLALPVGGNQLSKTWKGIAAYLKGGSYSLNGDGEESLQYPVYKDEGGDAFWSLVKSMVFGKNALGTAQNWVNSGFSSLNAKQTAVYQDMMEVGAEDREAFELIDAIRSTPKPDTEDGGDIQRENRKQLIRESQMSDACKDIAYYGLVASDYERELMDALADAGAGSGISEFVSAYSEAKRLEGDAERTGLRDVICDSTLTEQEKQVVMKYMLGPEEVNEEGNLTKYGKYVYATEQGMSTDEYMELYANNVSVDKYMDMLDTGLSSKGAMDLTTRLAELDTKDLTNTQKWRAQCDAIMAAGLSEQDQVAALVSVSYESTGRMFQVGYDHGIEPSLVLDFKRALPDFDDNSNGSYSQKEVTAAIDAIAGNEVWLALTGGRVNLTNEQKAVLWQLQNSSWKPNKNPYDKEVGQYIYDLVKQMKEK